METLPGDILPLLAAGVNSLIAVLRAVSRRFAAVCVMPPLERSDIFIRRGGFMLDLAARYDDVLGHPIVGASDMCILREILGKSPANMYMSTSICEEPRIMNRLFNGRTHANVGVGAAGVHISGDGVLIMHASAEFREWCVERIVPGAAICNKRCVIVINTPHGRTYWTGSRRALEWLARRVESELLTWSPK